MVWGEFGRVGLNGYFINAAGLTRKESFDRAEGHARFFGIGCFASAYWRLDGSGWQLTGCHVVHSLIPLCTS